MLWMGIDEQDRHSIEMADDGRRTWIDSLLVLSCVGIREGKLICTSTSASSQTQRDSRFSRTCGDTAHIPSRVKARNRSAVDTESPR